MSKNTEATSAPTSWTPRTDSEIELLLESVTQYASECIHQGIDWEGVKSKYEKYTVVIFVERYPKMDEEQKEEYPRSHEILRHLS